MQIASAAEQQRNIEKKKENPKEQLANGCKNMSPDSKRKANNMIQTCQVEKKVEQKAQKANPMDSPDFQKYLAQEKINLWWKGNEYQQAILKDFQVAQKFWDNNQSISWKSSVMKVGTNTYWSEAWVIEKKGK